MKAAEVQLQITDDPANGAPRNQIARRQGNNQNLTTTQQPLPEQQQQQGFSLFSCCFSRAPRHINLTESPDDDFYADNIVKLLHGYTAYRVVEPIKPDSSDPPLIVLVHGFQNSSFMWADVAELLADFDQGPLSNVLIYDIFGHGRSPWTGKNLSLDVLVTQIKELMESLGYGEKQVSLIGYDLGGAVAAGFAARFPNLTISLTMISPLGVLFNSPFDEGSFKSKYFGEYSIYKQRNLLPTKQEDEFYNVDETCPHRYLIDKQIAMSGWQLENTPGYLGSLLSLYRYFPLREMEEIYYAIGRHTKNVLIIWGNRDKIAPYAKCIKFMEKAFPNATIVDIADCGHNCIYEKFEEVVTELLQFHRDIYYGK